MRTRADLANFRRYTAGITAAPSHNGDTNAAPGTMDTTSAFANAASESTDDNSGSVYADSESTDAAPGPMGAPSGSMDTVPEIPDPIESDLATFRQFAVTYSNLATATMTSPRHQDAQNCWAKRFLHFRSTVLKAAYVTFTPVSRTPFHRL